MDFYARVGALAAVVAPTLTQPLPTVADLRARVPADVWHDLVERPLAEVVERTFVDDTVRGVVLTDAIIGTFARADTPSLAQNRCFLHHLLGNGTGEWRVPVGATRLFGDATGASAPTEVPEGSQLKVNLLLRRLPRLRSGVDPATAFAGTLHLGQGYARLDEAYGQAAAGVLPDPLPSEVYCHTLTGPSILGADLRGAGVQTLTLFGVHAPARLFWDDPTACVTEPATPPSVRSRTCSRSRSRSVWRPTRTGGRASRR